MKYNKPSYIEELPEILRTYFDEESFKNKPYPKTLHEAYNYLLFEIFKVDKDTITLTIKEGEKETEVVTGFTKQNFHQVFDDYHWSKLDLGAKITALYWYFEEVCNELKIYKPQLIFSNSGNYHIAYYNRISLKFNDERLNESAYSILNTIAHELKHAEINSKEQTEFFLKNECEYINPPNYKAYNKNDEFEKFCYDLDYQLYCYQPNEIEAYNYGYKKAREIFAENKKLYKKPSAKDIIYFKQLNLSIKKENTLLKTIFKDEFIEQLDKRYLLESLNKDVKSSKNKILEISEDFDKQGDKIEFKTNDNEKLESLYKEYEINLNAYKTLKEEVDKDTKRLYKRFLKEAQQEEDEYYDIQK